MNRTLPFILAAAALLRAPAARAQGGDPVATAQSLFDQAKQLIAQGKVAEACPKLLASFKLDPKPGTGVNLADCYEKNGQIASAWGRYLEAASLAQRAGQGEREQYARAHAATLEPKVARLTVTARAAVPGLEVRRDGELIDAAILGTPLPVDPGKHTVEARAPGKKPWSKAIEIASGPGNASVDIPALEAGPIEVPGGPPLAGPPLAEPPSTFPRKPLGLGLIGVGGAGVVLGAIMGGLAVAKHGSLAAACNKDGFCAGQDGAISTYHTYATVSDVGLFAGGALAVAGLVLVATAPRSGPAQQGWVRPVIGPGFTGAAGRF